MGIDEKLSGMDATQLQSYRKKEKIKATIGTVVSVVPVTAAAGAIAGAEIGYLLMPYVARGGPPETDFAMGMFAITMSAAIVGAGSWISGAAYTAKKWYNTYKAGKKLEQIA